MNLHSHIDKVTYFFIACALVLIIWAFAYHRSNPLALTMLYIAIAISLLSSNVPRVLDIPLHFVHPLRLVNYFSFGVAVVCFVALCLRHIWT